MKQLFSVSDHRPTHHEAFKKMLNCFFANAKDGLYTFEPKRVTEKRTLNQNSYLWSLLTILADEVGLQTPDAMLVVVMKRIGMGRFVNVLGLEQFDRDSTQLKDTIEFKAIIDECFNIASFMNEDREPEHHIILPVPPQKGEK